VCETSLDEMWSIEAVSQYATPHVYGKTTLKITFRHLVWIFTFPRVKIPCNVYIITDKLSLVREDVRKEVEAYL
jgi:hypothetical protein